MKIKHKFTVKRSSWLRGEGTDLTFLLREKDGKRCCLGFYAQSLGVPDAAFGTTDTLVELQRSKHILPVTRNQLLGNCWYMDGVDRGATDSAAAVGLMSLNDRVGLEDSVREKALIKAFKEIDIKVTFED